MFEGFMGIKFPAKAKIEDIVYVVRTETGKEQYAEMILSEIELEERMI